VEKSLIFFLKKILEKGFGNNLKQAYSWILITLLINVFVAVLEGSSFAFILFAFGALTDLQAFLNNSVILKLPGYNFFNSFSAQQIFSFCIIIAVLLQAFRSVLNYIGQVISAIISTKIQVKLQQEIYCRILDFTFPYVSKFKAGELTEYVKEPEKIILNLFQPINQFLVGVFTILISIVVMGVISYELTLITLILMIIFGLSQKRILKKIRKTSEEHTDHIISLTTHIIQTFQGLKTIFTFDQQKISKQKIGKNLDCIFKVSKKMYLTFFAVPSITETFGIVLVGICCVLGSFFFKEHSFSVASLLLTFITVTYRMASKVQLVIQSVGLINLNFGSLKRIEHILNNEDKEFELESGKNIESFKRSISIKNVFLKYPSKDSYSLQNISAVIKKGATVAFVGPSGAGKSSLIDLLINLYKPSSGSIEIDDMDLNQLNRSSWRQKLGVVSQDTFILNESVEENIRFGFDSFSFEEVVSACKIAGAHDFISLLPEGYNTLVGERGHKLSGGERQRLALARAIIRNPEILILDEATSNLDSKSEKIIQEVFEKLHNSKTIIIIAHRLSTIMNADEIFVIDNGFVIERGNHQNLLKLEGTYSKLWDIQTKGFKSFDKDEILDEERNDCCV
jgi:subfamily B ATP-binding cassette protein MsbA